MEPKEDDIYYRTRPIPRELGNNPEYLSASRARFSFFDGNIKNTKPTATYGILDVYHYITNHYADKTTEALRSIKDPEQARRYKAEHFAYCCFCGTFETRANSRLIRPSGLICLDFDHLENVERTKNLLIEDPSFETLLLFVSPSGHGLKWIIEINPEDEPHFSFFRNVSRYLKQTYNLEADPSGKDIARACFLPFDEKAYISREIIRDYENDQIQKEIRYREMAAHGQYRNEK